MEAHSLQLYYFCTNKALKAFRPQFLEMILFLQNAGKLIFYHLCLDKETQAEIREGFDLCFPAVMTKAIPKEMKALLAVVYRWFYHQLQ